MKIRAGDIVLVHNEYHESNRKAMVCSIKGYPLAEGMIHIRFRFSSLGNILPLKDCKLHTPREEVKKWWLWL